MAGQEMSQVKDPTIGELRSELAAWKRHSARMQELADSYKTIIVSLVREYGDRSGEQPPCASISDVSAALAGGPNHHLRVFRNDRNRTTIVMLEDRRAAHEKGSA